MYKNLNWGNNLKVRPSFFYPKNLEHLRNYLKLKKNYLPYGNGRSYGDVCINSNNLIVLKKFNKIIKFDTAKGILNVEAGAILADILPKIISKGWFIPVTPGTKYVSFGGMIANNVHGKNTKKNKIKDYIVNLKILLPNNKIINCSKSYNKTLFDLTVGGFGLTGIIISASIKLKKIISTTINQKIIEFDSYKDFFKLCRKNKKFTYSVFWISYFNDKKISGLSFLGNHCLKKNILNFYNKEKKMNIIFFLLLFFKIRIKFFNELSNFLYKKFKYNFYNSSENINNFFYPQDFYKNWNLVYGKKGFFEIQILINKNDFKIVLSEIAFFLKKNSIFSPFIIIKKMQNKSGYLNFDGNGISLSMDFQINKNFEKLSFFFNDLIKKYNLKFNCSKDLILKKETVMLNKKYKIFKTRVRKINNLKINSIFSSRIGL